MSPLFEERPDLAALAGAHALLDDDVRRDLRAADAEVARLDAADGGGGAEDDLDRAVEGCPEGYVGAFAVEAPPPGAEALRRLVRGGAQGAGEFPGEVEQAGARRQQAE